MLVPTHHLPWAESETFSLREVCTPPSEQSRLVCSSIFRAHRSGKNVVQSFHCEIFLSNGMLLSIRGLPHFRMIPVMTMLRYASFNSILGNLKETGTTGNCIIQISAKK